MVEVESTRTLQAETKTGRTKFWRGLILRDDEGNHYTQNEFWQVGPNGESVRQRSEPYRVTPKNVGRANETTPLEQARIELNADYQKKIDKGYHPEGEEHLAGNGYTLPMLAHPFAKKAHKIVYPVYVQPKFDGTRMLYNSQVGHWSRQGKAYLPEVVAHLSFDTRGLTLDGELILPEGYTFQDTVRAIKKYRKETTPLLAYRVYDVVDPEKPFRERFALLKELVVELANPSLILTQTRLVENEEELAAAHAAFTERGYEGTMVRDPDSLYSPGHRSDGLLKLKDFVDDEFLIVGYEMGQGKDYGTPIWECQSHTGKNFFVRPEGTLAQRQQMWADRELYVGKMLTVRFQRLSDEGVPIFPVGVGVRDYE